MASAFVFIWIEMEYLSNMKTGGKTLLVLYFMNLVWCTQFDNFLLEVCDAFCYVRSFILSSLGFQQFFFEAGDTYQDSTSQTVPGNSIPTPDLQFHYPCLNCYFPM